MPGTERGSFLAEDPPATPGPAQGPNAKTEQVAAAGVEQDACPPFFPPDELLHRPEWQPDIQEAVTRPREDDDLGTDAGLVGRFQHGALLGHRPRTLATWLVTATSPSVVDRIAQVLGGHPQRDPITGHAEVVTASTTVDILLPGLHAIRVGWQGIDRRACDGTSREDGRSCICPSAIAHRRSEARLGHGCQPRAEIIFRLVEDPALGAFTLLGDDWSFVETAIDLQAALRGINQPPATARLGLLRTLHKLRSGRALTYTHPVITLVRRTQ